MEIDYNKDHQVRKVIEILEEYIKDSSTNKENAYPAYKDIFAIQEGCFKSALYVVKKNFNIKET